MALLALKLILTPLLVGTASLGARRWGPMAGGWIVSLPLTSGPVALFLALDQGPTFAAAAAHASLAGCLAIAAYCLTYSRLAERGWLLAVAVAAAGWLAGALLAEVTSSWLVVGTLVLVVAVNAAALALMPVPVSRGSSAPAGRGDIAVRMAVGAFVVVFVTGVAPLAGPTVSGLLAMVPIVGTILAVFAQRAGGPQDGSSVQRGILAGLFGTAAFLAVVAWAITPFGVAPAFIAAIAMVALVQFVALRVFSPMRGASPASGSQPAPSQPA
ncbi:MAG: hypothetical protein ACHQ01_08285 [Candidatus Limnocylindrales bacterium]